MVTPRHFRRLVVLSYVGFDLLARVGLTARVHAKDYRPAMAPQLPAP